jgi:hypothetical protein
MDDNDEMLDPQHFCAENERRLHAPRCWGGTDSEEGCGVFADTHARDVKLTIPQTVLVMGFFAAAAWGVVFLIWELLMGAPTP